MSKLRCSATLLFLFCVCVGAQTTPSPTPDDDIIRVSTTLIQTDVVVTDDNDNPLSDLSLGDFEVYDNGKKQDLKFLEFVSTEGPSRSEGLRLGGLQAGGKPVSVELPNSVSAAQLKRVVAFVVDDLTLLPSDLTYVRAALNNFVDNQMKEGDLVAIIRTYGGKGLLQQFTGDRPLLRRAIANITYGNSALRDEGAPTANVQTNPALAGSLDQPDDTKRALENRVRLSSDVIDETQRGQRGRITLGITDEVIKSLQLIPGRKSIVLISGGIPIYEQTTSGNSVFSDITQDLRRLIDNAVRAGVVVNTLDPRGLQGTPGVARFQDTPARSAMDITGPNPAFGRGSSGEQAVFGSTLTGATEKLGLNTMAKDTGGVAIADLNDLSKGLDRIMNRSKGYYVLAYRPTEEFDNKFHKLEIKVKRKSVKIYQHSGYIAKADTTTIPRTKQEEMIQALRSPLLKKELDVSTSLSYRYLPGDKAALTLDLLIDGKGVNFTKSNDGKYQAALDVAGFVYGESGKLRGGFNETLNLNLNEAEYRQALKEGLTYTQNTELPSGAYQVRTVVREGNNGQIGTDAQFLELPGLSKGNLLVSSVFLHAVEGSAAGTAPTLLDAARRISRKKELRYSALIYNAKTSQNATQVTSRVILSQGSKIIFEEPEQKVVTASAGQLYKIGQLGISKLPAGRYVLTLIIDDPLADKKYRTIVRSVDFTVTE